MELLQSHALAERELSKSAFLDQGRLKKRWCKFPKTPSVYLPTRNGVQKAIFGHALIRDFFSSSNIKHHQASSSVIKHHQVSSSVIKRHQASSSVIKRHQVSSSVIKRHQPLSSVIKHCLIYSCFLQELLTIVRENRFHSQFC